MSSTDVSDRNGDTRAGLEGEEYPAPSDSGHETIGMELRRAREASGLTLEKISARTKIRPGILEQIEADDHASLPALTYTLGFVKAFARAVGLDPVQAAERYGRESRKGDPVPTMVGMQPLEERRRPGRPVVWWSAALVLVALVLLWAWGAGWFTKPVPTAPDAVPAQVAQDVDPEPVAPAPPPLAEQPVALVALDEVWLRVNVAGGGETLFTGTLQKGDTLDVPSGKDWVVRTGRAGALAPRIGGTQLGPLGADTEHLRDQSLKPEALATKAGGMPGQTPATNL